MSLWRQISRGLRALTQRPTVDRELDDEVRDYFERARAELDLDGLSEREAARVARLRVGDASKCREEIRSYGWENVVETTLGDLRLALRGLAHSPIFAAVGILTLALGIGASTAIFSAVVPILVSPLPYPEADRIVMISDRDVDGARMDVTYGTYEEIVARSRSFDGLAVADAWRPALAGGGEPERLNGDRVSASYFRVLGVAPALGRDFETSDDLPRGPRVAIVSSGLAKRRYGSAIAIHSQPILLDGDEYTVIGVMPAGFENVLSPAVEIWAPRQYRTQAPFASAEWGHHMRMVGRLAPGVSVDQAEREMLTIAESPWDDFSRPLWAMFASGLRVESLQGAVTRSVRPALLAILGAVCLLLVIACANVTNLLLARGVLRRGELVVRAALGAGPVRLVRQLLTESLLLALLGGAVGLGVAAIGVRVVVALAPAGLPRVDAIRLDLPAFFFSFAITAVVGIAVGLVPALRGASADLRLDLHAGTRATRGGHNRLRRALVVTEVALALVLLTGAGLLYRSVDRLLATAPGFDVDNVLTMQIVATGQRYESNEAALQYFASVLDAVRKVPGVMDAALTSQLPLSGEFDAYGVAFETAPQATPNDTGAFRYAVTLDWFRTMRIPLLRGRILDARDRPGAPEAVVISESLARRVFGEQNPLGQRVRFGPEIGSPDRPWDIVVGVVADVKQSSLALTPRGAFYVAMGQWPWVDDVQSLVARTRGDAAALTPAIKSAIWSVDPTPPIARIATMEGLLSASEAQRRFVLNVLGLFALGALVLATLGLYGVIAGSVAERTREIGVRVALGATPLGILGLVVRQGLLLTAFGIVVGIAGAVVATRGLATLLFGVTTLDPVTYAGVIALLVAVSLVACWAPARRATRVDPTVALRTE